MYSIYAFYVQGVTVEAKEDNVFEWKCSIKADVSFASPFQIHP